jgi:glycosyltransferase involved in cell wall biosynthesis
VIANSESTARSVRLHSETQGGRAALRVAPPGVQAFPQHRNCSFANRDDSYFAVLGTIEPRKNHLLLLNLWSRLAATMSAPPRLLVIGARGWENEQVLDMLERSRRLRGVVEEHNALSDAQVGSVLARARALLLPSFAEGYGLPLAEALASGIPVLCSDIAVFREVGRDVPEYLDPLDLRAWSESVLEYACPDSPKRAAQMRRLSHWRAPRWNDHFNVVEQLLGDLDTGRFETVAPDAYQPL